MLKIRSAKSIEKHWLEVGTWTREGPFFQRQDLPNMDRLRDHHYGFELGIVGSRDFYSLDHHQFV
jgi:hypothetical protein